jgi:hypothetical protein
MHLSAQDVQRKFKENPQKKDSVVLLRSGACAGADEVPKTLPNHRQAKATNMPL